MRAISEKVRTHSRAVGYPAIQELGGHEVGVALVIMDQTATTI
jgi:hypothetical protein